MLSVSTLNSAQLNKTVGVAYKNLMKNNLSKPEPEEAALQAILSLLKMIASLTENDISCALFLNSWPLGSDPFF